MTSTPPKTAPPPSLRALLVDDEPLARDELGFMLEQCESVEVVAEAEDATGALAQLDASERAEAAINVVFADLRMGGPDGIALADAVRARFPGIPVVIVSAHDEGALRAFDVDVVDYLLKPVRLERLRGALAKVRQALPAASTSGPAAADSEDEPFERLAVRRRGSYVVLDLDDVIFFETRDELVWAVTADDRFSIDLTLSKLEGQLGSELFFRSHRGALVRLSSIRAIEPRGSGVYELVMEHPEALRVSLSREKARLLRERIPFTG